MEKIIVIIGPAGAGKATIVNALAKYFEAKIIDAGNVQSCQHLKDDITYIKASEKLDTLYSFLGNQDICDNYKIIQKLNNCLEMLKPIDVKESNKIEKRNKYFDRNWSWKNSEDQMKRKVLAMRKKGL